MKTTRPANWILLCLLLSPSGSRAQGSAGSGATIEPRHLIDVPTAGMLPRSSFVVDLDFYQQGGVLLGISAGILDRLSFGISYGGSKLIGGESPVMNEIPGVNIKIRVIEESIGLPAIAIGFDSQGKDGYIKEMSRYVIKSPGFYAAASKNYAAAGFLSFHGGVNYTLEHGDEDKDVNFFVGIEKSLGPVFAAMVEYNLGSNDSDRKAIGKGRGYLNAGLRWTVGGGLTLGANLKDLFKNGGDLTVGNRTVNLEYVKPF
jgi:hypothetical protein